MGPTGTRLRGLRGLRPPAPPTPQNGGADVAKLKPKDAFATKCVHAGVHPDPVHGAVNPATQPPTTFRQPAPAQPLTFDYSRAGNPTREALEEAVAILERGAT